MEHYFDYAATYPTEKSIIEKSFSVNGNPSSPHAYGGAARKAVEESRNVLAKQLACTPEEIYFTSGATESNNTAVYGVCKAKERACRRIVTDDSQHPSLAAPIKYMEENGWEVIRISTRNGMHDPDELAESFSRPVALACFMSVNNETGAAYDIRGIRKAIDKSGCGAHLHIDAVQGFMKHDSARDYRLCDSISVSAHKIGGFKGTGVLVLRKGSKAKPLILGGSQERGFRSGTENINGIISFAESVKAWNADTLPCVYEKTVAALGEIGFIELNIPVNHCSHIISCVSRGIRSETLINYLSSLGVYCSASSACSARAKGNAVLEAYGLSPDDTVSALRISISPKTTDTDIQALKDALLSAGERFLK